MQIPKRIISVNDFELRGDDNVGSLISIVKNVTDLIDNSFQLDFSTTINVPNTAKNRALLGISGGIKIAPSFELRRNNDLGITFNGLQLNLIRAVVLAVNEDDISLTVMLPIDYWAYQLEGLQLKDLTGLPEFTLSRENYDIYNSHAGYNPDDPSTFLTLPLVDYGNDFVCNEIVKPPESEGLYIANVNYGDFREWLSVPYLLDKMFCHIGYTLKGDILKTQLVKELYSYLLKEDYYLSDNVVEYGQRINFMLSLGADHTGGGVVQNLDLIANKSYHNGNMLVPLSAQVVGAGGKMFLYKGLNPTEFEIKGLLKISGNINDTVTLTIKLIDEASNVTDERVVKWELSEPTIYKEYSFITNLHYNNRIIFEFDGGTLLTDSWFEGSVKSKRNFLGDLIKVQNRIGDYNCLNFFKGFIGLLGLTIEENLHINEITLRPYADMEFEGQKIEGFYSNNYTEVNLIPRQKEISISYNSNEFSFLNFVGFPNDSSDSQNGKYSEVSFNLGSDDRNLRYTSFTNPFFHTLKEPIGLREYRNTLVTHTNFLTGHLYIQRTDNTNTPYIGRMLLSATTNGNNSFHDVILKLDSKGNSLISDTDYVYLTLDQEGDPFNPIIGVLGVDTTNLDATAVFSLVGNYTKHQKLEMDATNVIVNNPIGKGLVYDSIGYRVDSYLLDFYAHKILDINQHREISVSLDDRSKVLYNLSLRTKAFITELGVPTPSRIKSMSLNGSDLTMVVSPQSLSSVTPCMCLFKQLYVYHDLNSIFGAVDTTNWVVESLKINGNDVLPSPNMPLGAPNTISFQGSIYQTNIVDFINSLKLPYITASYALYNDFGFFNRTSYMILDMPRCYTFEMTIKSNPFSLYRITQITDKGTSVNIGTADNILYPPYYKHSTVKKTIILIKNYIK